MSLEAKIIHAATSGDMATVRECLSAMHPQDWSRLLSACEWIRDEDIRMRWEDERNDELADLNARLDAVHKLLVTVESGTAGFSHWVGSEAAYWVPAADLRKALSGPSAAAEPDEPLNLPVLGHTHDTDAGGNCRDPLCGYNADVAHFAEWPS